MIKAQFVMLRFLWSRPIVSYIKVNTVPAQCDVTFRIWQGRYSRLNISDGENVKNANLFSFKKSVSSNLLGKN